MDSECVLSVWTLAVLPSALCGLREGSVLSVVLFDRGLATVSVYYEDIDNSRENF